MPISPIGAIAVPNAAALAPTTPTVGAGGAAKIGAGADAAGGGNMFADSLQQASQAQGHADELITQAATGKLNDLTSVMSAMTEAQLQTQLTVAVRNKAVESFNEIMRMQL
jgi:flagellar hook-basal body complex protein FliE